MTHEYGTAAKGFYGFVLNVAVPTSINISARDNNAQVTQYGNYALYAELSVGVADPRDLLTPKTTPAPAFAPPPPQIVLNVPVQPLLNQPFESTAIESSVARLDKKRFLTLSLIPEDESLPPVKIQLIQKGTATEEMTLEILTGDQLLEQFKTLPDGRYRLELHRTLGDDPLDERTVLETVITNGIPANPLEEVIEQLRRSLQQETEGSGQDGAQLESADQAIPVTTVPAQQNGDITPAAGMGAIGGLMGLAAHQHGRGNRSTNAKNHDDGHDVNRRDI